MTTTTTTEVRPQVISRVVRTHAGLRPSSDANSTLRVTAFGPQTVKIAFEHPVHTRNRERAEAVRAALEDQGYRITGGVNEPALKLLTLYVEAA